MTEKKGSSKEKHYVVWNVAVVDACDTMRRQKCIHINFRALCNCVHVRPDRMDFPIWTANGHYLSGIKMKNFHLSWSMKCLAIVFDNVNVRLCRHSFTDGRGKKCIFFSYSCAWFGNTVCFHFRCMIRARSIAQYGARKSVRGSRHSKNPKCNKRS